MINLNKSQQGPPKTKSSSLGSFSVVSAETLDTMMSHQSQDMEYPGSSSSKQTMLQGNFKPGQVLLRDETSEVHMQEAGPQLPATVLSMSTGAQQPEIVPLLSVDSGDQERGVRKAVCYFTQQSEAGLTQARSSTSTMSKNCPHAKSQRQFPRVLSTVKFAAVPGDLRLLHLDLRSAIINGTNGAPMRTSR